MFMKLKSPETDDKKISACEGKILSRNFNTSRNAKFVTSIKQLQKKS